MIKEKHNLELVTANAIEYLMRELNKDHVKSSKEAASTRKKIKLDYCLKMSKKDQTMKSKDSHKKDLKK